MANPLLSVPGLGGYVAQRQMNEQGALGQLQQAQAVLGLQGVMEKRAQEEAFRQELAQAPDDAARQAIALKYASPDKALDIQSRTADRREAAEARATQFAETLNLRQQALEDRKAAADQRITDSREKAQFDQWYKQQQLTLQKSQQAINRSLAEVGIELKKQGNEVRLERFNVEEREKRNREIEQQIQKTQTAMKDVQPMMTAAHQLNDILSQYAPEDVPGLGFLKNTELGKVALTGEGKNVASSVKLLGSAILKAMSGAAVTPSEEIRQMAAQMADGRFSAQDFYIAWPKISKWVGDQGALGTASLSGPAKERFVERTGLNLDPIKPRFTFDGKALVDTYAPKTGGAIPPPPPGFEVNK